MPSARAPLSLPALLLGSLSLGSLLLASCFIEAAPPASFRFTCESDGDCPQGEACAAGLCQVPCGESECPEESPICFNGYCSAVCLEGQDICPSPQECLILSASEDDISSAGICAIPCSDSSPCAEGQVCFEGACVTSCMSDEDCGAEETCLANVCIPASAGTTGFP